MCRTGESGLEISRIMIIFGRTLATHEARLLYNIIKQFERKGLNVYVAYNVWKPPFPLGDIHQIKLGSWIHKYVFGVLRFLLHKKLPCTIHTLIRLLYNFLLYIFNGSKKIDSINPDAILCEDSPESVFIIGSYLKYPVVFRIYDMVSLVSSPKLGKIIEREAFKRADVVAAITKKDAAYINRTYGIPTSAVYCHVPPSLYSNTESDMSSFISRLYPYWIYVSKHNGTSIGVILNLVKKLPYIKFVIVGPVCRYVPKNHPPNLIPLGLVSDRVLHTLYVNCTGVLIPYFKWPTGDVNKFRDALTYHKPVVITPAIRDRYENLRSYENCIVVSNFEEMIEAVRTLTYSGKLRRKLIRGVDEYCRDHLTLEHEVQKIFDLLGKAYAINKHGRDLR